MDSQEVHYPPIAPNRAPLAHSEHTAPEGFVVRVTVRAVVETARESR